MRFSRVDKDIEEQRELLRFSVERFLREQETGGYGWESDWIGDAKDKAPVLICTLRKDGCSASFLVTSLELASPSLDRLIRVRIENAKLRMVPDSPEAPVERATGWTGVGIALGIAGLMGALTASQASPQKVAQPVTQEA